MAGSHSIQMLFSVYNAVLVTLLIQVIYCAPWPPCDYKASKLIPFYRFGSLYERESLPHHQNPFQKPSPPAFGIQGFPDTRFTNLSTTGSNSSPFTRTTNNTTESSTTSESAVPKLASTTDRIMIDEKILAQIFGDDDVNEEDGVNYTTEDNSSSANNSTEYSKDDRFGNAALDATITLIGG